MSKYVSLRPPIFTSTTLAAIVHPDTPWPPQAWVLVHHLESIQVRATVCLHLLFPCTKESRVVTFKSMKDMDIGGWSEVGLVTSEWSHLEVMLFILLMYFLHTNMQQRIPRNKDSSVSAMVWLIGLSGSNPAIIDVHGSHDVLATPLQFCGNCLKIVWECFQNVLFPPNFHTSCVCAYS